MSDYRSVRKLVLACLQLLFLVLARVFAAMADRIERRIAVLRVRSEGGNSAARVGGKDEKVYAVRRGRRTGLFATWRECEAQVKGYSGAEFRAFRVVEDATRYLSGTL